MAAQTYGTQTTIAAPPRVNLLPPEIAERLAVRRQQLAMIGTGLAAVAVVGVMFTQASAKVSQAEERKAEAQAAQVSLDRDLAKLKSVKDIYAQVDVAKKTLATAMRNEIRWSSYLHDLTLTIPENVWLNSLEMKMNESGVAASSGSGGEAAVLNQGLGTVTVTGSAFGHNEVASWLESLSKQKGYSHPYFTKSEDRLLPDRVVVDFDSTVYVTEKALSGRYSKGLAR